MTRKNSLLREKELHNVNTHGWYVEREASLFPNYLAVAKYTQKQP